ncbi:hypothetical protein TcBrA4_0061020 [Trypanosoma cruzi]|nr:hypothetical protein TcBrA4_0061020 [Trypanosoma cruzi]
MERTSQPGGRGPFGASETEASPSLCRSDDNNRLESLSFTGMTAIVLENTLLSPADGVPVAAVCVCARAPPFHFLSPFTSSAAVRVMAAHPPLRRTDTGR